jgi:UDP-N-acetylmuramoyl-tripeptide--D-alanyl-D-alanine ligase
VWSDGAWNFELQSKSGFHPCRIQVAGRHNVKNAVAAAACALSVGISIQDIAQGLHEFEPVKGRSRSMTFRDATHDITVVDDSYNANPDSVCAAIDVLCELPGPQLLVLGDMGEVGDQGPQFHTEVGVYARAKGLSQIFSLGTISHHTTNNFSGGLHFEDMAKLQAKVMKSLPQFNSILVKGSRFMKMERVLDELHAHLTKGDRQHVA